MPSNQHAPATGPSRAVIRPGGAWLHFAAALTLGTLNTLTFAPAPHGGWWQPAVFAVLFWLLSRSGSRWAALGTGLAFGFGNFVTGVYWVYISMHTYGGMAAPLAGGALALFALYLAIFPGLAGGTWYAVAGRAMVRYRMAMAMADARADTAEGQNSVSRALKPCVLLSAAAFGATWQVGEWLRGVVLTGFPWLSSGYAQVDGPFAGLAPFIGVYGAGFATAVAGALITLGVLALYRRQTIEAMLSVVALVVLCGVSAVAGAQRFVVPADAPLTVRLLQGNIPQDIKFEQSGLDHSIDLYQHLITEKPADLIVTPETALPILINDTPRAFAETVRAFADSTGTAILLGAAGTVEQDGHLAYTNSTFGVTPGQNQLYRYDKHHLVPFGEFIPWGFHWFVDLMRMPLGDFARGPVVQTPFVVKGERFSVDICYEDIFGDDIAESLRGQAQPASVLVNSTNLGWFGDSIALDQHLQIARMRALETQRPILRATNTGTTAIIDSDGTVQGRLPVFTVGSLDGTVQGTRGLTPYVRFGDAPLLAVSLVLIAFALLRNRKRR